MTEFLMNYLLSNCAKNSLKLILNYLSRRKQRRKIRISVCTWYYIIIEVPLGSILGPLLFNIFINYLFLFIKWSHVCNFADDNTLYSYNKNLSVIFQDLVYDLKNVLNWFRINSLKLILNEFNLLFSGEAYPIHMFWWSFVTRCFHWQ